MTIQNFKISKSNFVKKHYRSILLLSIIFLSILFRFYQLGGLPPGLHADEAANGLDIFKILENHDYRVVYDTNGPREAMFFYFQAIFVALLGNSIVALRIAPALFGVLTVIMVYLYSKDWFGSRVALWSAFFMAVNPWVVTISRDGFRASLVPFFISTVLYFGGKAYKTQKSRYFIISGLFFGLGFYTYTAYHMFGISIFCLIIYLAMKRRKFLTTNIKNLIFAGIIFTATILPLADYIIRNPEVYSSRATSLTILSKDISVVNFAKTLTLNTRAILGQFNVLGDHNSRHNFPDSPLLNIFASTMLLIGIFIAFKRRTRSKYIIIMALFFTLQISLILTADRELPHGLRSIGTTTTVFTLAGIGIDYLISRKKSILNIDFEKKYRKALIGAIVIFMIASGWLQYFVYWGRDPRTYIAYHDDMVAVAKYINEDKSGNKIILVSNSYREFTAKYLTHNKSDYQFLSINKISTFNESHRIKFIFVFEDHSTEIINALYAKYGSGRLSSYQSSLDNHYLFYVFQP